jgi:hypothetical protein
VNVSRINWARVLGGGLVAAILCFLSDGFLHEKILHADWQAVYAALGAPEPTHAAGGMGWFVLFDLGRGLIAVLLYAAIRPRFGAGPGTAACAGTIAWLAISVTTPAQFIPLGFLSTALWLKAAAFQLVTQIAATIAGAALYKETPATVPQ